jgi:hypothetical protein
MWMTLDFCFVQNSLLRHSLEQQSLSRVLESIWRIHGGDNGTRNFALAVGRADSGDYPVVVVLRPLKPGMFRFMLGSGSTNGRA